MLASVLSVAALLASSAFAITLKVPNTVAQCDKLEILASGAGKLNVAVLHADDECGTAVKEWLNVAPATFNYTVKFAAGTKLAILNEENDSDAELWDTVTVTAGTTDCLTAASDSDSANFAPAPTTSPNAGTDNSDAAKNVATGPDGTDAASTLAVSSFAVVAAGAAALVAALF